MTRKPRTLAQTATNNRNRLADFGAVAAEMTSWKPQAEVLREVEAVPTIWPSYDRKLGVGGHPISRLVICHGPSNEGKTTYVLGLIRSFLLRDHFVGFGDAERSTPQSYVNKMVGPDLVNHPAFMALPISYYEQTRGSVREFCERISKARDASRVPKETSGLIVIDSLRKLVPKDLWDKLGKAMKADLEATPAAPTRKSRFEKPKKVGIDGAGGRAGQIKAAMNSAWMDELIPLLADHRISMVIIARETVEDGEGFMAQEQVKIGGGVAVNYDASLRLRAERDYVYEELGGKNATMVGERIQLSVQKTKIHRKEEKVPRTFFHTSNGTMSPEGFDLARDCLELGLELGVIAQAGSYYAFDGSPIGQGKLNALKKIQAEPDLLVALERAVRAAP